MHIKNNKLFGPVDLDLTQLIIQPSIKEIANQAFQNCTQLKTITIPCVSVIGTRAFSGCTSLQRITMLRDAELNIFFSQTNTIGEYAFYDCRSLQHVDFIDTSITSPPNPDKFNHSETNTFMGSSVFENCYKLETVSLPTHLHNIGSYAFWRCNRLCEINLPPSITSIGYGAFFQCNKLTSLTLPPVPSLPDYTFYGCYSLHTIELPSTIKTIGMNVFNGCSSLKTVILPPIEAIADSLFESCTSLQSIHIPQTVSTIGYLAFYRCFHLVSISMYTNLSAIKNMAFTDCVSLHTITLLGVPSIKFLKILIKSTIFCPSLDTILCYNYMFVKHHGEYKVHPRRSLCSLVSKGCWISEQCKRNVPQIACIVERFCGPAIQPNEAVMFGLVLNKIL